MILITLLGVWVNANAEPKITAAEQSLTANNVMQAKFGPFVRGLISEATAGGERTLNKSAFQSNALLRINDQDQLQSYIRLSSTEQADLDELKALNIRLEIVNTQLNKVQAWVDISQLDALSQLSNVEMITTPSFAHSRSGGTVSEGDTILSADQLRELGFSGQGIKVGVVADGSNDWMTARDSGDLPASLTQYGSCTAQAEVIEMCISERSCNEGTAMAEIIHDLAPDAELAVAAASTTLEFIDGINQLATVFQADIIVDDLGFFMEPFFEDGEVAQAVAALPDNILFISAAGNNANNHYESDFILDTSSSFNGHEFSNDNDDMGFVIPARSFVLGVLQWNEEFDAPSSDYNLFLTTTNTVLGSGQNDQSLPGSLAIEAACAFNSSSTDSNVAQTFVKVQKAGGNNKRLELFLAGSPLIQFPVPEGSIIGHAGLPSSLTVAAINASEPGNDTIASYSSRGPSRVDFPSQQNRAKPDLTAIDGVMVSGAGSFSSPFFGTSAAAPHVAGIAAQLLSSSGSANARTVKAALIDGVVDLGPEGFDSIYGFGRVDAILANAVLNLAIPIAPIMLLLEDDED